VGRRHQHDGGEVARPDLRLCRTELRHRPNRRAARVLDAPSRHGLKNWAQRRAVVRERILDARWNFRKDFASDNAVFLERTQSFSQRLRTDPDERATQLRRSTIEVVWGARTQPTSWGTAISALRDDPRA
jgi:hypothetical protein